VTGALHVHNKTPDPGGIKHRALWGSRGLHGPSRGLHWPSCQGYNAHGNWFILGANNI